MQRPPGDPQAAFRAALHETGLPLGRLEGGPIGPNEALVVATPRLPGLDDAGGAAETARVLRAVARLLDAARAPAAVGQQFRDNVAAALLAYRSRARTQPWDGAATADMFMELYGRVLGFDDAAFARVRATLLDAARIRPRADRMQAVAASGRADGSGAEAPQNRSSVARS